MTDLRLAWCSTDAARLACERWHYSGSLPGGKRASVGVWEDGRFIGAVIFTCGATPMIARPFGLLPEEVAELSRVALDHHDTPTTRVLGIACRMVHRDMPGLRLLVSFADTAQGHEGTLYRAANWYYLGDSLTHAYRVHGRLVHPRTLYSRYGVGGQSIEWLARNVDPHAERVFRPAKRKFAYPLDRTLVPLLDTMALAWSKSCAAGVVGSTPADPVGGGGSIPTAALCEVPA